MFAPRTWPAPWGGAAILLCAAVAYDVLLYLVRRADRAFPSTNPTESTWWFGYARDLTNLAGVAAFALGFRVLGFRSARALLLGAALALLGYGLDYFIARKLEARFAKVFLATALGMLIVPMVVLRVELSLILERTLASWF